MSERELQWSGTIDVEESEVNYLGPVGRGVRGNYDRGFVSFDLTTEQGGRFAEIVEGHPGFYRDVERDGVG